MEMIFMAIKLDWRTFLFASTTQNPFIRYHFVGANEMVITLCAWQDYNTTDL